MCVGVIGNILTGCSCIDNNLKYGINPESLTLIYGEPETGKTTLAIQCAISCAKQGYKTLYVDCDNTFSGKRFFQVTSGKFEDIADLILLLKPKNFKEQTAILDRISDYITSNFGLLVIDTFTSLYRARVAESSEKTFELNRELNRQMAILAQTTKIQKLPIIITSQVRSVLEDSYHSIAPVATRVLKFWANTIISLKPTESPQKIKAVLEKTDENTQEVVCYLRIDQTGIHDHPYYR